MYLKLKSDSSIILAGTVYSVYNGLIATNFGSTAEDENFLHKEYIHKASSKSLADVILKHFFFLLLLLFFFF